MKIVEEYDEKYEVNLIEIESANYINGYVIQIRFTNGFEQLVDFEPFLSASLHPSIKKYLNKKLFTEFHIVDGNINWNDYDMIFPVTDLYKGKIE